MRLFVTCVLCFIILLTNRWLSFEEGISVLIADDTKSYMVMAKAAPGLPTQGITLASNHTKRLVPSWVAGLLRYIFPITDFQAFLLLTIIACALIVVVVHSILSDLGLSDAQHSLCMAVFILNPYTFRYYLAVPVMLSDLVFVLGLSLILRSLFRSQLWVLAFGGFIAVCGRQNALILIPVLLIWFIMSAKREQWTFYQLLTRVGIVIGSIVIPYLFLHSITSPFSERGLENESLTGLFTWFMSDSSRKGALLTEFIFRAHIALLFIILLLAGICTAKKVQLSALRQMPRELIPLFGLFFSLYGFALLGGPELFMSGVTRYISHTLVIVIVIFAVFLRDINVLERLTEQTSILYFVLGVLLITSSFHHLTNFAGGTNSDKAAYFSVIVIITSCIGGLTIYLLTRKELQFISDEKR